MRGFFLLALGLSLTVLLANCDDDEETASVVCTDEPFSETFMRGSIETLAQESWEGRKFDSGGLPLAAQWIAEQFGCIGLTAGAPTLAGAPDGIFEQPFDTDGDDIEPEGTISDYTYDPDAVYSFTNIIGSIPGSGALADEFVVVGAHMDALGKFGGVDNAMVPGADDDATGITALFALAKQILSEGASANRRTIVFAAWGIEEDPFYVRGSIGFFDALDPAAQDDIMYYVNFDMIGKNSENNMVYAMGAFDAVDGFDASPGFTLMSSIVDDYPELNTDLSERGTSSDHVTFCSNGVPYVFFFTEDSCYHQSCDTPENIDYGPMASIMGMATDLTKGLATESDLATAKGEFPEAFAAAYPGVTCQTQD